MSRYMRTMFEHPGAVSSFSGGTLTLEVGARVSHSPGQELQKFISVTTKWSGGRIHINAPELSLLNRRTETKNTGVCQ